MSNFCTKGAPVGGFTLGSHTTFPRSPRPHGTALAKPQVETGERGAVRSAFCGAQAPRTNWRRVGIPPERSLSGSCTNQRPVGGFGVAGEGVLPCRTAQSSPVSLGLRLPAPIGVSPAVHHALLPRFFDFFRACSYFTVRVSSIPYVFVPSIPYVFLLYRACFSMRLFLLYM